MSSQRLSQSEIIWLMVYRAVVNFIRCTGIPPSIGGTALRSGLSRKAVKEGVSQLVTDGILVERDNGEIWVNPYDDPHRHEPFGEI